MDLQRMDLWLKALLTTEFTTAKLDPVLGFGLEVMSDSNVSVALVMFVLLS